MCTDSYACADQAQGQQQLLLAELKRVGTQQERLKQAVSEAAAEAASRGESFEISPLKSYKISDSELAQFKSLQLTNQLKEQAEVAVAPTQLPEEEASPSPMAAIDEPAAMVPAPAEAAAAGPAGNCAKAKPD